MKIQTTVSDLTDEQWARLQEVVLTEYPMPINMDRTCVVFEHGDLERHVEMPLIVFRKVIGDIQLAAPPAKTGWPYDRYGPAPTPEAERATQTAGRPVRTPAPINDISDRWYPR